MGTILIIILVASMVIILLGITKRSFLIKRTIPKLKSPFPIERWNACITLGNLRAKNDLISKSLTECLMDKDFYVRKCSLVAIGKTCNKSSVSNVMGLLNDSNWIVRCEAIKVLGKIGDQSIIPNIESYNCANEPEIRSLVPIIVEKLKRKSDIFNKINLLVYSQVIMPIIGFLTGLLILK